MAHLADKLGTEVYDETEQYDARQGRPTLADEQKLSGLSESANKPAPEKQSFRITRGG